jgi:hypothetical protein
MLAKIDRRLRAQERSMIDHSRHAPLRDVPWDPDAVEEAIVEIAADALAHFGPDPFWPGHPLDEARRHSGIYYGATGVVWGLDYLRRIGAIGAFQAVGDGDTSR